MKLKCWNFLNIFLFIEWKTKDLVNSKERDFCTENSRSARNWCCLMLFHSNEPKKNEAKFYCRHSSMIIKQFKIHDSQSFLRCKTVSSRNSTMKWRRNLFTLECKEKRKKLSEWNHYTKNIIENAEIFNFSALELDEFIDFHCLRRFHPISSS